MLELLSNPDAWIALFTLTLLEIVLGIDNIVFIAILASRLPVEKQELAYRLGLLGAMVTRVALLLMINWVMQLTQPLFAVMGSADSLATDTVYVELNSEIVLQSDGRGGVGMYTLEGAPTVIAPNGRRLFTFPTGTWASIDDSGANLEGRFHTSAVRSLWNEVDRHPEIGQPGPTLGRLPPEEAPADLQWALLVGLGALFVLGLVFVGLRAASARKARTRRR